MKLNKRYLTLLVPMLLVGFAGNIMAEEKKELKQVQTEITIDDVLKKLQNSENSRILEVEFKNKTNGSYYEVELIDKNNSLWKQKYDAVTGKLIESSQKKTVKPVKVKVVNVDYILNSVRKSYQGKVIEIKLEDSVYEVELIDKNGVIREIKYEASTGRFIREVKED